MSELIRLSRGERRFYLLTTVSTITLLTSVIATPAALAQADDQPRLWIEAGWHVDSVSDSTSKFALPFGDLLPPSGITGPLETPLNFSHSQGDEGKLTFRPDGGDWVFTASIRYGRAHGKGQVNQTQNLGQASFATYHTTIPTYPFPYHRTRTKPAAESARFVHADTLSAESHYIVDFEAGKDVGLGLFGRGSSSTISAGVRFANFKTALNVGQFHAKPDAHFDYYHSTFSTKAFFPSSTKTVPWFHTFGRELWHNLAGNPSGSHDFIGIGPTVNWDASTPLWGNPEQDALLLDWSVNVGVLFGKQKNIAHHQTVGSYNCYGRCGHGFPNGYFPHQYQNTSTLRSSRNVTIPNAGGSVGLSYRLYDAKISVGYRADFFFGAIGTSFDTQHTTDVGFHGPYATVSIGLGG